MARLRARDRLGDVTEGPRSVARRIVEGRHAAWLTHGSLLVLTALLLTLLLRVRFWIAFVPCAIVQHRIGVLLHEYIHGIPLRRYKANLRVLTLYEGLLLTFGLAELFRGTHLAHHRWLNTDRDPAFGAEQQNAGTHWGPIAALEGVQHFVYLWESLRGRHRYVIPSRLLVGLVLSIASLAAWILVGRVDVALKIIALTVYNTLVPISFRGAVEHHSRPDDPGFANEYRVVIPLFNLNRHVHHHLAPRRPWYLLEYQTRRPLSTFHYFTHWFRVYVIRDYVLMRPAPAAVTGDDLRTASAAVVIAAAGMEPVNASRTGPRSTGRRCAPAWDRSRPGSPRAAARS
jgi:fatty acid desaturase